MKNNPVVVVTGAGGGIGRSIAHKLINDKFNVLAIDINSDDLEETVNLSSNKDSISVLVQDINEEFAPQNAIDNSISKWGRFDGLVNNAGIGNAKAVHLTDDHEYDMYMNLMMRSLFRFSREAIKNFSTGNGFIVNIASVFGIIGSHNSSAYSAAKAGVIGLTKQMAVDYGPKGIRVNAVAPGLICTNLTKDRIEKDKRFRKVMVDTTPFPRIGTPEDIANAVAFLCSPSASFINGHTLTVDGGWSVTNYVPE